MSNNPAGWYPDPFGRAEVRWWTGSAWAEEVATQGKQFTAPPIAAPAAAAPQAIPPPPMVVPQAVAPVTAAAAAPRKSAAMKIAIVGVVALVAGGAIGYVVRGSSSKSGTTTTPGGGGKTTQSLATPILQGLASLDSYEFQFSAGTVGPTSADSTEMSGTADVDSKNDASHFTINNTTSSPDSSTPSTGTTESWRKGTSTCSYDGETYTSGTTNPFESQLGPVLSGLFDIVIPAGSATLKGTEKVAGVDANHYTFTVKGLGAGSGSQVTENTGELWVAKDGGYVLRYDVKAAMTSGPAGAADTQQYAITLHLELKSVNQPVSITLPSGCPTT